MFWIIFSSRKVWRHIHSIYHISFPWHDDGYLYMASSQNFSFWLLTESRQTQLFHRTWRCLVSVVPSRHPVLHLWLHHHHHASSCPASKHSLSCNTLPGHCLHWCCSVVVACNLYLADLCTGYREISDWCRPRCWCRPGAGGGHQAALRPAARPGAAPDTAPAQLGQVSAA